MKKLYCVGIRSNIPGGSDYTYVMAENEDEALKIGKPMLNYSTLTPDFLNQYSRFYVYEAGDETK